MKRKYGHTWRAVTPGGALHAVVSKKHPRMICGQPDLKVNVKPHQDRFCASCCRSIWGFNVPPGSIRYAPTWWRKELKLKEAPINLILNTDLVRRAERFCDGVEIISLSHAVNIALKSWVEMREDMNATMAEIDAQAGVIEPPKS